MLPVVAVLAVLAVGVGSAIAAIPNNGMYYACLTKSTGAIKVINYPKVKCAKGTTLIKWSQQGPAGPTGATGATGPKGDQGPAGPADWNAIANKPAGFADGVDNVGVTGYVTQTDPCNNPINGGGEYVIFEGLPRSMVHQFQLVNTKVGEWLYIERVEWYAKADGTQDAWVRINDDPDASTGTCNLRRISFTEGISVARAKQQLKMVEVSYAKNHRR
jgi:hypothetical protein